MNYWDNNKDKWIQLISVISYEYDLNPIYIEKDVMQSVILSELANSELPFVFKGGTSLSKGYGIINRFSEDIDIAMNVKTTNSIKQRAKQTILELASKNELNITNIDKIQSRNNFNKYTMEFNSFYSDKPIEIILETSYLQTSYPANRIKIGSIVGKYIEKHKISGISFPQNNIQMNVQTLERTFIDKVFAICDYYLRNQVDKHSRHLYDIAMLLKHIDIDENLSDLIYNVRIDRQNNKNNVSSDFSYNIVDILSEIIDNEVYKKDYNDITLDLLFEPVSYDYVIDNGIYKIVQSELFKNKEFK